LEAAVTTDCLIDCHKSKSRLFFFKSLQEDVTAAARKEATTGEGGGGPKKKNPKQKQEKVGDHSSIAAVPSWMRRQKLST
jgi:hypothetical protein